MYRPKQTRFPLLSKGPFSFGGALAVGVRKTTRPVSTKQTMHLVLRSEMAKGRYSLLLPKNARLFHHLMSIYANRFDIRIYNFAIVGNHAHLLVRAKSRRGFQNFLRVFPGQLAQRLTKSVRGMPLKRRFWSLIAFSRIVQWGKSFEIANKYITKNIHQAAQSVSCSFFQRE